MKISGRSKTLDFLINLLQEPEAMQAFVAFLLNRNTNNLLTAHEIDQASYSQFMETMHIFACAFYPSIAWRDFYNLSPERMVFDIATAISNQAPFRGTFKFSNQVFMQSLIASMLSYVLIGEASGLINRNPPQHIERHDSFDPSSVPLSDWAYALFVLLPGIFLYVSALLIIPALTATYVNLRLFVAINTIGATTPLQRAVINDDLPKFQALLFKGADMYKSNVDNRKLHELQPENPQIILQTFGYVRPV